MKILIISQYFWPENFVINEIAFSLKELGNDVIVITGKPNYPEGKIFKGYKHFNIEKHIKNNVEIFRVPIFPRLKSLKTLILNYLSFILSCSFFSPYLLINKKFDIIFIYGVSPILQAIPAIFISKLFKKPSALWVQDLWPESIFATKYKLNNFLLYFLKHLVNWIYKNVDFILVQSKGFIKKISDIKCNTPIAYLPNSYPHNKSVKSINIVDQNIFKKEYNFIFAGNLGKAQSLNTVLDTADLLKEKDNIGFILIGDGSEKNYLINQASKRNLRNIIFLDRQTAELMPIYFKKASALLVTLSNNQVLNLTLPSKIQAYLSSGIPILAAINGTSADILIESGAALVSPAENAIAFRDLILEFIKLPIEEKILMGKNGKDYFKKNFDHKIIVNKLINYLNKVIQDKEKEIK